MTHTLTRRPKIDNVKDIIGKSIKFLIEFMQNELDEKLEKYIGDDNYKTLVTMINFYTERLRIAKGKVEKHYSGMDIKERSSCGIQVLNCPECNEETVVIDSHDQKKAICYFCDETFFINHCLRCEVPILNYQEKEFICCDNCMYDIEKEARSKWEDISQ